MNLAVALFILVMALFLLAVIIGLLIMFDDDKVLYIPRKMDRLFFRLVDRLFKEN